MGIGVFTLLIALGAWVAKVYVPHSASVPFGLYRATPVARGGAPRNTLVLVCLPHAIGIWAHRRGYVGVGHCAGSVSPLGKMVVGVTGDTVRVTAVGVTVNNVRVANSRPLRVDTRGRLLPRQGETIQILPSGTIWLASPSTARGFDSRYFGAVPSDDVQAVLEPLWTR